MNTDQLIKNLKEASDLLETLQKFEILDRESKKSSAKLLSLGMINNAVVETIEELERVQLAQ